VTSQVERHRLEDTSMLASVIARTAVATLALALAATGAQAQERIRIKVTKEHAGTAMVSDRTPTAATPREIPPATPTPATAGEPTRATPGEPAAEARRPVERPTVPPERRER
jgi:hypothetical protein